MRYLFGFLCVCALGVMPAVGCIDPLFDTDCPTDCYDGNECTRDVCHTLGAEPWCGNPPVRDGTTCDFGDLPGVCIGGVCCDLCEDDGDECTRDCNRATGMCDYRPIVCEDSDRCTENLCDPASGCDFTTPVEDGKLCYSFDGQLAMCVAGDCVAACDAASEEAYHCPINGAPEDVVCCPGNEYCMFEC